MSTNEVLKPDKTITADEPDLYSLNIRTHFHVVDSKCVLTDAQLVALVTFHFLK